MEGITLCCSVAVRASSSWDRVEPAPDGEEAPPEPARFGVEVVRLHPLRRDLDHACRRLRAPRVALLPEVLGASQATEVAAREPRAQCIVATIHEPRMPIDDGVAVGRDLALDGERDGHAG